MALDLINDQDPRLMALAPINMDMDTDLAMVNMVPETLVTEDQGQVALPVMALEDQEDSPVKDTHPNRTLDMHLHRHMLCPRP
ncbi:hypothetical protein BGZ82_009126 [Podila clonocystis]|nr:hypothetical protein BGZ82_009126 [Podila clonocystis]